MLVMLNPCLHVMIFVYYRCIPSNMDNAHHSNLEVFEERERNGLHDDELDADILLLVLLIIFRMLYLRKCLRHGLKYSFRRAITRDGEIYIENVQKQKPSHFRQLYRMYPEIFLKLCVYLREQTSLCDTRYITVEEMVATFLLVVGQNSRYCHTKDTFNRSTFATSVNFHKVLRALNQIAPSLMAKPEIAVPTKIRESTRFYPYFKVYLSYSYVFDSFLFLYHL